MREDKVKVLPNAENKVDIFFEVTMPEPTYGTKVMGETPEVESLWVAVFGSSGFLKEFVQAEVEDDELATTNYNTTTPRKYNYKVSLSLTDSDVKVHFIANPPANVLPFRNEDQVIPTLMTSGNQDAYWQRIEIPGGIQAERYPDDYSDPDKAGEYIIVDGKYVVDNNTKAYFQDIPLIRNFAKIEVTVKDGAAFTLLKYAVVNKPKSGSVAPYNNKTGKFVEGYQSKTYRDIKADYPGYLPLSAEIDKTIPTNHSDPAFSANPIYIYERPIPTQDPTTIIIYGTYNNQNYYYKVDLMDKDGYYAIYRNFRYKIVIQDVVRAGESTPEKAYNSAGSGDISADINATNLTDVSDGEARIYVSYTDTTLVGQPQYVELKYKFIPHVSSGAVDNNSVSITNKNDTPVTTPGDVIGSDWNPNYANSTDGWRTLRFKTSEPGSVMKTQEIKVTGSYNNGASKLYRIVTFHLMNIQTLDVVCVPNEVPRTKGEKVDVLIKLPKDLPRSLFPLQLKIEADKKSITPDGDNLPVNPGKSIIDGSASYQFIKTLSKDEYDALQDTASTGKVIVTCHFKTSRDNSAGSSNTDDTGQCKVYAVDKDEAYFSVSNPPGYFTNYTSYTFGNPRLNPTDVSVAEGDVYLTFTMGSYKPTVTIKLKGLKPADNSLNLVAGTTDTYTYNPRVSDDQTIHLLTSNDGGVYSASLSANHYKDAFIANLNYTNLNFTQAQVPLGVDKDVEFSFNFAGTIDEPLVEDVVFTLTNIKPADTQTDGTFTKHRNGTYLYHPTEVKRTHSIKFKTEKFVSDASVSMSGASYNPAQKDLVAPTRLTVSSGVLSFTGTNAPVNGRSVTLYINSTSNESFSVSNNTNASFNVENIADYNGTEEIYFQYSYRSGGLIGWQTYTYRSSTYTLSDLTASSMQISGWTRQY